MNIAVLDTAGRWNIGNEFINQGMHEFLKESMDHGDSLVYFRQFESANERLNYPSDWMTEYNKRAINACDALVIGGGSCLSRYHVKMFQKIRNDIKIPIILVGASFYENIKMEGDLYRPNVYALFDHVFARDKATFNALPEGNKYRSLDMAFWMKMPKFHQERLRNYSVVNIDSPENGKMQSDLVAKMQGEVWLSRNNPSGMHIFNGQLAKDHNIFVGETYEEFLKFYGHAKAVATNRVHTFLACLLLGTPVQFCHDKVSDFARYFLFHEIAIPMDSTRYIQPEEFDKVRSVLDQKKIDSQTALRGIFNSYRK